ncbi:MAG: polysaccharide biosynthesis protein [Lachnospiraceae bacterium]|nr:polysaccharide biosynthesis protein [Lachnospiraceae bacterium]
MFSYKGALFAAFQRSDISSKIMVIANTLCYISQIVVLLVSRNYYYYIVFLPVGTVLINFMKQYYSKKFYPQFIPEGSISHDMKQEIGKKIKALFGQKLSFFVLHASDSIVVSFYFGLEKVAQYENYYYILNLLIALTGIVYTSINGGIGNKLEVQSDEINQKEFMSLTFFNSWLTMFCTVTLVCLYQTFMKLWVGPSLMFDNIMMSMFAMYFFVYQSYKITLVYKDSAGIWWEDRFRPYIVMGVNLAGNLILSYFIGIYGVILSTLLSMFISAPWATHTVLMYVFSNKEFGYYKKTVCYIIATLGLAVVSFYICGKMPLEGFAGLVVRALFCLVVPNICFAVMFAKTEEFSQLKYLIKRLRKRKTVI